MLGQGDRGRCDLFVEEEINGICVAWMFGCMLGRMSSVRYRGPTYTFGRLCDAVKGFKGWSEEARLESGTTSVTCILPSTDLQYNCG